MSEKRPEYASPPCLRHEVDPDYGGDMAEPMHIRHSVKADLDRISDVHLQAFGQGGEGPEIVTLVRELLKDPTARPLFSFVAEDNGGINGHILFTRASIDNACQDLSVQILAPLAVLPASQGTGIGQALMEKGLQELRKAGVDLVFVLGHPAYYPRAGFRPAIPLGLTAPYPIPEKDADAWMVQALKNDLLGTVSGQLRCADVLNHPMYWHE